MIDPAGRTHTQIFTAQIVSPASQRETPAPQSFRTTLSHELDGAGAKSEGNITLPSMLPGGQQSVTRQISDSTPSRGSSTPSAPTTSTAGSQTSGMQGLVINFPNTSASASSTCTSSTSGSGSSGSSFDQSYWASQPAAVQQLQNIQNPTERQEVATQLAQEGYSIDVPIMVWGWDPQITTAARESFGYTWVPSAEQQPVAAAPGLTFNGTSYNPSNPPSGSITV